MNPKKKGLVDANHEAELSNKKSSTLRITPMGKRRKGDAGDGDARKKNKLYAEHRKRLHRYGLNDATINRWGTFSIGPENRHLLDNFGDGVKVPGIALPICPPLENKPTCFLYRPDKPRVIQNNGNPRICKYEHPRNGLNRLHVPRAVQSLLSNSPADPKRRTRIVITEGPIKAEVATQEGIACVALAGVWNWRQKFGDESVPIEDLTKIEWDKYEVEICFDSDAATNPNVRRAELALAAWLIKHGAKKVQIIRLPTDKDGSKVGLDDYLRTHSAENFEKLPRPAPDIEAPLEDVVANLTRGIEKVDRNKIVGRILDEEGDPSERERLFKLAADRTGISRKALRDSAESELAKIQARRREDEANRPPLSAEQARKAATKLKEERKAAVETILDNASNSTTLRAQCASDGELGYLAAFGEAGSLFVSTLGVIPIADLKEHARVADPPPDRSPMSADGIRRFQRGEAVSAVNLFKRLRKFIQRRVIFTHTYVPTTLALWVMGTYSYALFNYYGYVWLTSLGPGCGKSLLGKILSMVAFNATPPLIDPTPATVFRDIDANGSTFILDEMDHLDPESKGALLGVLNAGFERGAKVRRMTPAGEGWAIQEFDVYGPKVIAGINQIPRPLQTRSFRVEMRKKKDTEDVKPFRPDRLGKWTAELRDDTAIWALRNAEEIADIYDQRDELVPRRSKDETIVFDDRLRDIFAALYAVAAMVDEEAGEPVVTPDLYKFLKLQAGARDSEGVGDYALAAHVLYRWAAERWHGAGVVLIKTKQAMELFAQAEIDWAAADSAKAKSLLRKLNGRNDVVWWKGRTERGYVFFKRELQDLVERNPLSAKRTPGENR